MGFVLTFLLGIGNFAMHKAVLESRHPMLALEFLLLVGALLLSASGHTGWGWAYLAYSALNAVSAWLILSRRV